MASRSLHSAEEFGYGGQSFGRAFNPSEIAGDHGINAAIELRYLGLLDTKSAGIVPYAFIDAGKVWNKDAGADDFQAASVGGGARWQSEDGTFANLGAALPMGRTPEHSLYGTGRSARFTLRIGQELSF
jgi:hemolysin activation/secretion protein